MLPTQSQDTARGICGEGPLPHLPAMTVASPLAQAGPFAGTGSNTVFPFSFQVFKASDVRAVRTRRAGNLFFDTELAAGADFVASASTDQRNNPGGAVTLSLPLQTDETLTLLRRVEATQNTAIPNQGGFYPEVIEAALDKLTMLVQQLENELRRALLLSVADTGTNLDGLLAGIRSAEAAIAAARRAAAQAAADATSAREAARTSVTQAESAQAAALRHADRAAALIASIAGGPVANVNGKTGPHVTLTPADLTLLPNLPTDGPSEIQITYGGGGEIQGVVLTFGSKTCTCTLQRDAQGDLESLETVYDGLKRVTTLAYASGVLTGLTGVTTRA